MIVMIMIKIIKNNYALVNLKNWNFEIKEVTK